MRTRRFSQIKRIYLEWANTFLKIYWNPSNWSYDSSGWIKNQNIAIKTEFIQQFRKHENVSFSEKNVDVKSLESWKAEKQLELKKRIIIKYKKLNELNQPGYSERREQEVSDPHQERWADQLDFVGWITEWSSCLEYFTFEQISSE
jgi:hypothetical protein